MTKNVIKDFIVGEDPKITTVLDNDLDSGGTVTVTIKDPGGNKVITDVNMTEVNTRVYTYIYMTTSSSTLGQYEVTITVTNDGKDDKDRLYFNLVE